MTVNTDNFDINNWGEFVHKKALNDVIQQINQVDAEQNNAISKISDLANQANQNAVNASKIANMAMQSATNAENTATALKNDVDSLTQKVNDLENSKVTKTDAQKQSFEIKFTGTDTASNKYSGVIGGNSYPLNANSDVFTFFSGRFKFDSITFDATALYSGVTLTLESELPNFNLYDDRRMNGIAQITDKTNEITAEIVININSATEIALGFPGYVYEVLGKLEWLKTGTKQMWITFNDIN